MKLFVVIPKELLDRNLARFWKELVMRIHRKYPKAHIMSNYTGIGSFDEADVIIFIYEYKDTDSYKALMEKCKEQGKTYNFFKEFYTPEPFYSPDEEY